MAFEALSYRHVLSISGFPQRWLPLVFLYDPDLPLFPICYFHVLPTNWVAGQRPGYSDRAFGYVESVTPTDIGDLLVKIVCNKDLGHPSAQPFLSSVTEAVRARLGLSDPVTLPDIVNAFTDPMSNANAVLVEIWHRVVSDAYGNSLPFGNLWDPVMGLTRFVASFYSPGGRKGELIQTHYFAVNLGEPIQSAGGVQTDFHLLPTFYELTDTSNPLNLFPRFRSLRDAVLRFHGAHSTLVPVAGMSLSRFNRLHGGSLNTAEVLEIFSHMPQSEREMATECFNAFDKGPLRTVVYLLILADLMAGRLSPATLTSDQCSRLYSELRGTYQSPKTVQIYAQQAHGNPNAMPLDTWVETFLRWPLTLYPTHGRDIRPVFQNSTHIGKVERLIWVAAQARKVHSSACDDAIWCTKFGAAGQQDPRGANPLACKICLASVRAACPAYARISNFPIVFNSARTTQNQFRIDTSQGNNTLTNQSFVSCEGHSIYWEIRDEFSPVDVPTGFAPYPQPGHAGQTMTVAQFVNLY